MLSYESLRMFQGSYMCLGTLIQITFAHLWWHRMRQLFARLHPLYTLHFLMEIVVLKFSKHFVHSSPAKFYVNIFMIRIVIMIVDQITLTLV